MRSRLGCTLLGFACFLLALGSADAVPARPLYEPPEPPRPLDLRDTVWDSKDIPEDRLIVFVADGTLMFGKTGRTTAHGDSRAISFTSTSTTDIVCFGAF